MPVIEASVYLLLPSSITTTVIISSITITIFIFNTVLYYHTNSSECMLPISDCNYPCRLPL